MKLKLKNERGLFSLEIPEREVRASVTRRKEKKQKREKRERNEEEKVAASAALTERVCVCERERDDG